MSSFSRRDFLKTGALGSILAGTTFAGCTTAVNGTAGKWQGKAKNIIFMVSDGMSHGTLALADHMKRLQYGSPSHWIARYEDNTFRRGLMDMASANSLVTDSAAAASSWGCGVRITNNRVNMSDNGEMYTPILEIFKNAGKKTGLVTTTRITHATPAGFIANVMSRAQEDDISVQMLERGADVFLGAGDRHFTAEGRSDGRDLYADFVAKGYHVVKKKEELKALSADGKPVLGIFDNTNLPYTIDHMNDDGFKRDIPTLAEMSEIALKRLSGSEGFILQIEGARIDHAAHSNDASGLVFDQVAFDDAIGVVLEFVNQNPDTLLIITSDHGNANPGLNGDGTNYGGSQDMFMSLAKAKLSNNTIISRLSANSTVSQIRELVEFGTTHAISAEHAGILRQSLRREYAAIYKKMSSPTAVIGQILANYTAVNFIGDAHTSDFVELASWGPGSEAINGFVKNTDLFTLMLQAAGVEKV